MGRKAVVSKLSEETKSIKRANFRIKSVAKKYGTDSQIYQDMVRQWTSSAFQQYVNIKEDGIIQISTKFPKMYEGVDKQLIMYRIEHTRGLKDIEKDTKEFFNISDEEWKKTKSIEKILLARKKEQAQIMFDSMLKEIYSIYSHNSGQLQKRFPELFKQDGVLSYDDMLSLAIKGNELVTDEENVFKDVLSEYDETTGYPNPFEERK